MALIGSRMVDNLAVGGTGHADAPGGAISLAGGNALGGGIFADRAACEIRETLFLRNEARGGKARVFSTGLARSADGAGGAIAIVSASLHLASSQCRSNFASTSSNDAIAGGGSAHGGALYFEGPNQAAIESTIFTQNSALGGLTTTDSLTRRNLARGGSIFNTGQLRLMQCTLESNTVRGGNGGPTGQAFGGAVASTGTLLIEASTLNDNLAAGGDAIAAGTNNIN